MSAITILDLIKNLFTFFIEKNLIENSLINELLKMVMIKQMGNHGCQKHTTGYPFFSETKKMEGVKNPFN